MEPVHSPRQRAGSPVGLEIECGEEASGDDLLDDSDDLRVVGGEVTEDAERDLAPAISR